MSLRAEKGEVQQRKPGRSGSSGNHRGYVGAGRGGGGRYAPSPPAAASVSSGVAASSLSTNRSFNKSGNGQAAQSRVNPAIRDTAAAGRAVQNGAHPPAPLHGFSEAPAPSGAKPVDMSAGNSRVPKPPPSQPAAGASDYVAPKTPPRGSAAASKAFPLQFGTISPGIMNGMQIPARTSSAPPNLDEQKRDQARNDTFRAVPTQPIPAAQKQQQQQRKDVGVSQSNTGESHPLTQTKRDVHLPIASAPTVTQPKPSVLPISGMPMSIQFQHSQVPLQFGGPSLQMQSQGVSASSLQMTMGLPVGNASQIPQQMFIPGIHSHLLQMGHQLSSQLGSLGIGIPSQFPQQQPGNFGGPRKPTVKITHPDTHEELRLDKRTASYVENSTGQRPLPNVTPQSQPIPTFTPTHPINYYSQVQPNSYNAQPIFFPNTSLPMTSTQMATGPQGQRYSYTINQGGQAISFINQSVLNSMPSGKPGTSSFLHSGPEAGNLEGLPVSATSVPAQATVKPPVGSYAEKVGTPPVTISEPISKAELPVAANTYAGKPAYLVTISAPVSKALPSVTVSRPISKAEAPVTSMPIRKAVSSVTITMPAIDVEAPKSLKPSVDTAASELQRVMAPEAGNLEGLPVSATSMPAQATVKPPVGSYAEKVGTPPVTISEPISKAELPVAANTYVGKPVYSVTVSAPVSKALPSVTVSRPISKAEAPATSMPIRKAESLVTITMPAIDVEAPKSLKPSVDTAASELQRVMAPISSAQQPKPDSETSDVVAEHAFDRHASAVVTVLPTQRTQTVTSASAPVTPVGEPGSVAAATDGRKREPVRRSESLKEHHKKQSKKDTRHPQQRQIEASDHTEGTKSPSSKLIKDNSVADVTTRQVSDGSENIHAFTVADASVPTAISLTASIEHTLSSGTSEGVKGQDPSIVSGSFGVIVDRKALEDGPSGSFGVMVEKKTLEDGPSVCSTANSLENDGVFAKQSGPPEISSLNSELDGTMSRSSDSSIYLDESLSMKTREEQKMWEAKKHGKAEALDTSVAKVCQVTMVVVNSAKEENNGVEKSEIAITCELNDDEKQKHNTSNEAVGIISEIDRAPNELSTTYLESVHTGTVSSSNLTSRSSDEDKPTPTDILSNKFEIYSQDIVLTDLVISPREMANHSPSNSSETIHKRVSKVAELSNGDPISVAISGQKDKPMEPTRVKAIGGKKKRKEILSKADAAGASDLYNAYKGPEEKHEVASTSESTENSLTVDAKHVPLGFHDKDSVAVDEDGPNKSELDDWEDAADISTPKLRTSENAQQMHCAVEDLEEHGSDATGKKKYSRDFLLKFAEQCTDLPMGFEIGYDIEDALISAQVGSSREPYPSPGRTIDRSSGASRGDRRMGGILDDGKWIKPPGSFGPGGDVRGDIGQGAPIMNLRPGQGGSHGVLKNPRSQPSSQFVGGILAGPIQSPASQGGVARNNIDADRWQRGTGFQRGLIPSPQTPLQVMHKAESKYQVGKVSDEEEVKQRQLKAILNKLTPQNFEKLFAQVKEVNIDNAGTLTGVISQIFDKALMEPTFCEMYANFCSHLAGALPDFSADNEKITFKRLLLNKCQEEFERGEREQAEADKVEEDGEIKQSEQEREQKRLRARRRMLGNIRLIGELYKKKMLTERIMHSCITKLLGHHQNPEEEDIEALCKLMSTIGEMIDHTKAKVHIDAYFDNMQKLSMNQKLSSRVRFLLRDAIDLRKNNWQQRRKVDGPKTIEEVHRDAAQERQAQSSRSGRGPVISSSGRRGQPIDYGPRGSAILTSPNSQHIGGVRNNPGRNYTQDFRLADRNQFDSRSVPLPQRPIDSDSITLGPQGGLARGMSIRGQPLISNVPSSEIHPSIGDPRRTPSGPNGYSSVSNRAPYSSKEETLRSIPDRSSGDRVFDRTAATPLPAARPLGGSQNMPYEAKTLSEEGLREKSRSTIREFYSAKDEDEVALCIKELNAPSYYPSMVSLWVTDSFERKDMERDLLAELLVNLCKSHSSLLSQMQLIHGFEFVLSSLEDAVNDAPKAAEFLGRIFAKIIVANVASLREIGKLIHEGGEEPGSLLEIGLASEVLASILEFIRTEKGDSVLNEIRTSSNLRLEDFLPPHPMKSKLDPFL